MRIPNFGTPQSFAVADAQRRLIGHGSLVLLWGFAVGFLWLFWLIEQGLDGGASGHARLWPIPGKVELGLPGTHDAWRMAHVEAIVNGMGLWLFALLLPLLPLGEVGKRRAGFWMTIVAWTIVIASTFDPLFENARGLRIGINAFNTVAFFLFYVGVVGACVLVAVIAYKAFASPAKSDA